MNSNYRKRLLISACFFNACTTYISEVHAWEKHGLISKRQAVTKLEKFSTNYRISTVLFQIMNKSAKIG